jgi:hypothetical protein
MAYQNSKGSPTAQTLDLFPDSLQRLRDIKDHLTKADERHWLLLSEAAQIEVELYRRATIGLPARR